MERKLIGAVVALVLYAALVSLFRRRNHGGDGHHANCASCPDGQKPAPSRLRRHFEEVGYSLVTKDGLSQVTYRPSMEELGEFYESYWGAGRPPTYASEYTPAEQALRETYSSSVLALAEKQLSPSRTTSFLDVGCGEGWQVFYCRHSFTVVHTVHRVSASSTGVRACGSWVAVACVWQMKEAASRGWQVRGVDVSVAGMELQNSDLLKFTEEGDVDAFLEAEAQAARCYDVVNLANVFEHLLQPTETLARISALLCSESGGVLIVRVPNDSTPLQASPAAASPL